MIFPYPAIAFVGPPGYGVVVDEAEAAERRRRWPVRATKTTDEARILAAWRDYTGLPTAGMPDAEGALLARMWAATMTVQEYEAAMSAAGA